jgi:hypothetical protein
MVMRIVKIPDGLIDAYIQNAGIPGRRIFLDLENETLIDVCEDAARVNEFESWAELSHKDHVEDLNRLSRNPTKFIEIPTPPDTDNLDKLAFVNAATQEKGVRVEYGGVL